MSAFDEILFLLKDGNWHNINEIEKKIPTSKANIEKIIDFLNEYEFVNLNVKTKKVKIQNTILELINEIQRLEKEKI